MSDRYSSLFFFFFFFLPFFVSLLSFFPHMNGKEDKKRKRERKEKENESIPACHVSVT
jgi:hypothetical protein